jgi:hypothetical protein
VKTDANEIFRKRGAAVLRAAIDLGPAEKIGSPAIEQPKRAIADTLGVPQGMIDRGNPPADAQKAPGNREAGEEAQRKPRADNPPPEAAILNSYPLTWDGDAEGETKPPELIEGMLPEVGVALLSGQWGMFKTFTAIDLGYAVMSGTSFAGRSVSRKGGVLFIAAEGARYVRSRLQGVKQAKAPDGVRIKPAPFAWIKSCPALNSHEALVTLVTIAKAVAHTLEKSFDLPLALIVIDTLSAAAMFRDANDTAENQRVMTTLAKLADTMGALVLAVDHFGKDPATGTRNSSAKEAAADTVLALIGKRSPEGSVSDAKLSIRKYRDGETGIEMPFTARRIELQDGGGMLVIDWIAPEAAPRTLQRQWPKKLHTLKTALGEVIGSLGFLAAPFPDGPRVCVVKREIVRTEFVRRHPGEPGAVRQAFSYQVKSAITEGFIQCRQITVDGDVVMVFWPLRPC